MRFRVLFRLSRSLPFPGLLLGLGMAFLMSSGHASMIQGEKITVETKEGKDGRVRLSIVLPDSASGMDAKMDLGFGTGLPTDGSQVSGVDNPVVDNKFQLQATRPDLGIDEVLEVEVLDGHAAQFSFPSMAPKRPDIAFVFSMESLKYSKALSGEKMVEAVQDVPGRYAGVGAEGRYWVFYGSEIFPPLIFTGFSPNRTTYLFSAGGVFGSIYNSDLTAAVSFLPMPDATDANDVQALREAAEAFLAKHAN